MFIAGACVSVTSGYSLGAEDDGKTKSVAVGSELRLVLPADRDWSLESTDTAALPLKSTQVTAINGRDHRIWLLDVRRPGDFTIRATGQAACLRATPPCTDAPVRYTFRIHAS
jgi:hypothetical protein